MERFLRTIKMRYIMMTTTLLIDTAIICGCILMYAVVACIIVTMIRLITKKIMGDVHEAKRTTDAIKNTEHVYHEERRVS